MAVELDHGNPPYLSPDIWVVPGTDPNGPLGVPVPGKPAYVWARVHNRGDAPVSNVAVSFYWGNPSTVLSLGTVTLIGRSFVTLPMGDATVLCLSPWIPMWINNGHECVIVTVAEPGAPPRNPNIPFDPANDPQVAQRNFILAQPANQQAVVPFVVTDFPFLDTNEIVITVRRSPMELLQPIVKQVGLQRVPDEWEQFNEFGLTPYRSGDQLQGGGQTTMNLKLQPEQQGVALAVMPPPNAPPGAGALFLIEEQVRGKVMGGIAVLVTT